MMALIVAVAILVFSADPAVQHFDLDQRPPPPPENIAVLMPVHGDALRHAGPSS